MVFAKFRESNMNLHEGKLNFRESSMKLHEGGVKFREGNVTFMKLHSSSRKFMLLSCNFM